MSIYGYTNHGNANTSQVTMEDGMNTMEKIKELERKQKEARGYDVLVLTEEEANQINRHVPVELELHQTDPLFGIPVFVAKDFDEFAGLVFELAFRQNKKVGFVWPKTDHSAGMEESPISQNESTKSPQKDTPTETTPTPED